MARQPGFFDADDRLRRLSDLGGQLEVYAKTIDFELFRPDLDAAVAYADGAKCSATGGMTGREDDLMMSRRDQRLKRL